MNEENVRTLRNVIASEPKERFDMSYYLKPEGWVWKNEEDQGPLSAAMAQANKTESWCGTAGCLAGWAFMLAVPEPPARAFGHLIEDRAASWLGLDEDENYLIDHWFIGGWSPNQMEASRDEAIAFLDLVLATGNPLASLPKPETV